MKRLLHIEYLILSRYKTFLVLLLLYFVFLALVTYGFGNFLGSFSFNNGSQPIQLNLKSLPIYQFPDVWHNMTYVSSFFTLILGILVIMFISNEIEYRTLRQHIMDGMTRTEFVNGKFLSIISISALSSLFVTIIILILGLSQGSDTSQIFNSSIFMLAYFVQLISFMSFAFLFAILFRRTGLSVILLLLWMFIVENIIAYKLPDRFDAFIPVKSMNDLIQFPFFKYVNFGQEVQTNVEFTALAIPIMYAAICYFLISLILQKRDL